MEAEAVAVAPAVVIESSYIVRVRRKRNAEPENALLVVGGVNATADETAAGPSKRPHLDEAAASNVDVVASSSSTASTTSNTPTAFRLIGTLPMPDVRDAARLFLPHATPKLVNLVDAAEVKQDGSAAAVTRVDVEDLSDVLMQNVAKVGKMELLEDPYLAVHDDAPLARPESALDGALDEDDGYVYDFYHAGTSAAHNLADTVQVRLPTDAELQMYFGGDDDEEEENVGLDDDEDSNAENYYRNEYPDEDEFGRDGQLENDTTSDDSSYEHYGGEKSREDYYRYVDGDDSD